MGFLTTFTCWDPSKARSFSLVSLHDGFQESIPPKRRVRVKSRWGFTTLQWCQVKVDHKRMIHLIKHLVRVNERKCQRVIPRVVFNLKQGLPNLCLGNYFPNVHLYIRPYFFVCSLPLHVLLIVLTLDNNKRPPRSFLCLESLLIWIPLRRRVVPDTNTSFHTSQSLRCDFILLPYLHKKCETFEN